MTLLIEERIKNEDKERFATLILADIYEISKELITAILFVEGYKTLNHTDLIEYVKERRILDDKEIYKLDQLRILRNKIEYEGYHTNPEILKNNQSVYENIIKKLRAALKEKLKESLS
jgi:hypothetical protein